MVMKARAIPDDEAAAAAADAAAAAPAAASGAADAAAAAKSAAHGVTQATTCLRVDRDHPNIFPWFPSARILPTAPTSPIHKGPLITPGGSGRRMSPFKQKNAKKAPRPAVAGGGGGGGVGWGGVGRVRGGRAHENKELARPWRPGLRVFQKTFKTIKQP